MQQKVKHQFFVTYIHTTYPCNDKLNYRKFDEMLEPEDKLSDFNGEDMMYSYMLISSMVQLFKEFIIIDTTSELPYLFKLGLAKSIYLFKLVLLLPSIRHRGHIINGIR